MNKLLLILLILLLGILSYQVAQAGEADYAVQGTPGLSQPSYCWQNCQPLNLHPTGGQLQPAVNVLGAK